MNAGDCQREICRFPTIMYTHEVIACDHGCPYKDRCRFFLPLPKHEERYIKDEEKFWRMIHGEDGE